jgi:hypothetical protein
MRISLQVGMSCIISYALTKIDSNSKRTLFSVEFSIIYYNLIS